MSNDPLSPKANAVLTHILKNELATNRLREGDIAEVTLLEKQLPRAVFFDLGKFGTGIVYGGELANARDILKSLNPGDRLPAKVLNLDGETGYAELSLAEAGKQRLWTQVMDAQETGEITTMKATGVNSGGVVGTVFDLKAFLPVSQLSNEHYPKSVETDRQKSAEELKKLIGSELSVKIINANPRTNKLIVSERETLNANVKELLAQYQVGQTVDGVVSGLADFSIFVRFTDNPQIEGLVHISEIDHRIIDSPKDVAKLGEAVKVKIIDIREGRVFLSMKALKADPWEHALEHFAVGQEVQGRVYKFNPFGATIDLEFGIQGMIHISEFGGADEMRKQLVHGEAYAFIVETIKPEERRLHLKLKR